MLYPKANYNALESVGIAYAREKGYTGKNVGIAIMDSGIIYHDDFTQNKNRIIAFRDFVNYNQEIYDDNSHGTHVAGIIASSGTNEMGMPIGVAPEANIIAVKVLDQNGNGRMSNVIAGLNWVIENKERYRIRVVNISVGTPVNHIKEEASILIQAVNKVWDAGLVVVVAAGNNGPRRMSITTPGISRKVITVGSYDDEEAIDVRGEQVYHYSGRGPTIACIKKPDIVAPGSNIISCYNENGKYGLKSGTSMSTPIVSGAVALLLQKHPNYTPKDVKIKLMETSKDLGLTWNKQGWGLLDLPKLLG